MAQVSASAHSCNLHAIHGERLIVCCLCPRSVFLRVSLCLLPLLSHTPTCTLTGTPSMWTAPRETPAAPSPNEEYCSLTIYTPPTNWTQTRHGLRRSMEQRGKQRQRQRGSTHGHRHAVDGTRADEEGRGQVRSQQDSIPRNGPHWTRERPRQQVVKTEHETTKSRSMMRYEADAGRIGNSSTRP